MDIQLSNTTIHFAHPNTRAFVAGYDRQDDNHYDKDVHYFRGGSHALSQIESVTAELVGFRQGKVILTTSGMSAFVTSIASAELMAGDIVVHGEIEYGQIYHYITTDLRSQGIIPVEVPNGDSKKIEKRLKQLHRSYPGRVKVIFLETVGNGPTTPVLAVAELLALQIVQKINPLIILDNTLPTDTAVPLARLVQESSLRIVGLESATKFYLFNQDLGGILFTYHEDLRQRLLTKRKRIGATPGPSLINTFRTLLPKNKKAFDTRNARIMRNTQLLSKFCKQAVGAGEQFVVHYPDHASALAPVFFVNPLPQGSFSSEELFYLLEEHGGFADLLIVESFGFHQTAVMHAPRYGGYLRFAGGVESKKIIEQKGKQLQQAFARIYSN